VAKMLMDYAQKLIMIIILKKIAGFALGGAGSNLFGGGGGIFGAGEGLSMGLPGMAKGGYIMSGAPGKDSVHILGMKGEYMMPKDSVDYYGKDLFDRLREKEFIKMAEGGMVGNNGTVKSNFEVTNPSDESKAKTIIQEGDTINNVTVKTNDIESFRQYLYENKSFITGFVMSEMDERGFMRRR